MPIYLIVPLTSEKGDLNDSVRTNIDSNNRFQLQEDAGWLIKDDGSVTEVCKKLKIADVERIEPSQTGSAIVVPFTSYYGIGPTPMWDWLKVKFENDSKPSTS